MQCMITMILGLTDPIITIQVAPKMRPLSFTVHIFKTRLLTVSHCAPFCVINLTNTEFIVVSETNSVMCAENHVGSCIMKMWAVKCSSLVLGSPCIIITGSMTINNKHLEGILLLLTQLVPSTITLPKCM